MCPCLFVDVLFDSPPAKCVLSMDCAQIQDAGTTLQLDLGSKVKGQKSNAAQVALYHLWHQMLLVPKVFEPPENRAKIGDQK